MERQPQNVNSRGCDTCNNNIHRTSMNKHLKSKKHIKNQLINDRLKNLIIPDWMFIENEIEEETNNIMEKKCTKLNH